MPGNPWESSNVGTGSSALDLSNLDLLQPFLNPTGYQQSNYTPLELQALMESGALMQQGLQPVNPVGQTLQEAGQQAAAAYSQFAPEVYAQGQQAQQGAAASAAHRGITGGMAQAPQMALSNQTQRQLNSLRTGLTQQYGQMGLQGRGQDIQQRLGALQSGFNLGQYPQAKASPLSNIFGLMGSVGGMMGRGGGGGGGGGSNIWGGSAGGNFQTPQMMS